jgi:hypothetical protein
MSNSLPIPRVLRRLVEKHNFQTTARQTRSDSNQAERLDHSVATKIMAVPFGFSLGDFVTVGKLIGQVVNELREVSRIFG